MEPQPALVRSERRVELDAEPAVHMALTFVVLPDDAELDYALRDCSYVEGFAVVWVLLEEARVFEG